MIVPMAGMGNRFRDAGFLTPKPLLPVRGRRMYELALESLPLRQASRALFVVRLEHHDAWSRELAGSTGAVHRAQLIEVAGTRGQAETVAAAIATVPASELGQSVLIGNCDTIVDSASASRFALDPPQGDGRIHLFKASGDQWSFASLDGDGHVVRVAEKVRISEWCSTGLYWFSTAQLYLDLFAEEARTHIGGGPTSELYVAPLLNRLVAAGGHVDPYFAASVETMGTPEELDEIDPNWRVAASSAGHLL